MARILLVEDDPPLRAVLFRTLTRAGHTVETASRVAAAAEACRTGAPEILILDLGLPDGDGLEFLASLLPPVRPPSVLVLSARSQESVKVTALDLGADDYLTKPFGTAELLARLRALERRLHTPPRPAPAASFGEITVDRERSLVTRQGQNVSLTAREYALLLFFLDHPGVLLTTRRILHEVWGRDDPELAVYVRVYTARLRRKLERDPRRPRHFVTEIGLGYRFVSGEGE